MKVLGGGIRLSTSALFRYPIWSQMIGNIAVKIADFIDNGESRCRRLLGLRLGVSFSNHPKHALKYAPNAAISWK